MSKGSRARPLSVSQQEFDENWNKIFKKKESCPCGRSPIARCNGWHNLTEEQFIKVKQDWESREKSNR